LGRKDGLPHNLISQMNDLEKSTIGGEGLNLNFAITMGEEKKYKSGKRYL
jgi:hypothetical protein